MTTLTNNPLFKNKFTNYFSFHPEIYDKSTDYLIIEWEIKAIPDPDEYVWYKNGVPMSIVKDPRHILRHHPDTMHENIFVSITFDGPNPRDSGEYVCMLKNPLGELKLEYNLKYMNEDDYLMTLGKKLLEREKYLSRRQVEQPVPVEPPKAEKKDAKPPMSSEVKKVVKLVEPPKPAPKEEEPLFHRRKDSLEVSLEQYEKSQKFHFTSPLINFTFKPNETIRLKCCAACPEPFECTWYRNGKRLAPGIRVNYCVNRIGACCLEIEKARYSDCGTYKVVASSPTYGEISQDCHVNVVAPVTIGHEEPHFTKLMAGK